MRFISRRSGGKPEVRISIVDLSWSLIVSRECLSSRTYCLNTASIAVEYMPARNDEVFAVGSPEDLDIDALNGSLERKRTSFEIIRKDR
jgi:hypothetical protein